MDTQLMLKTDNLTMSSLEIVDLINKSRKEGQAELKHYTFMEKVLKVLPNGTDQNFLGSYKDSSGKENKCYYFPTHFFFPDVFGLIGSGAMFFQAVIAGSFIHTVPYTLDKDCPVLIVGF